MSKNGVSAIISKKNITVGPFARALLPKNEEITLGNIRIVKLTESPDKILLQYINGGVLAEGGQFDKEKFEKHIESFFHENF